MTVTQSYITVPQPSPGDDTGDWIGVTFNRKPRDFHVRQVHWDTDSLHRRTGFHACLGTHCHWCLEPQKVIQRYYAAVTDELGHERGLDMNYVLYGLVKHWADKLGDDFLKTRLLIRRHGHGVQTTYE